MKTTFTVFTAWRSAVLAGFLGMGLAVPQQSLAQRVLWADDSQVPTQARNITASLRQFRSVTFQLDAVRSALQTAPAAATNAVRQSGTVISLPLPDGSSGRFRVAESVVMDPALAARYSMIKTYVAEGIDDVNATARLDVTPAGLHAMIRSFNNIVFIDPAAKGDNSHHLVFDRRAMDFASQQRTCYTSEVSTATALTPASVLAPNGDILRTYRLALSCTGEYAINKSVNATAPTKAEALAGIVSSVNRVTGVYEQELAIRLVLIPTTDQVIYLDPATDPYTNLSNGATLTTNQATIDNVIGTANYDIGHIFNTADGGIAGLGVVCRAGQKARGSTGLPNPTGDAFDIDYVAHEMGHQFGGNHTFNGNLGSCAGGNRSAANAYEPGSGTTIMAYAGICGANNTQSNSDPYFHSRSFDEITTYVRGNGACSVNTPTGNKPPVVNAGLSYSIPLNTPFTLTGSATDPDGDQLTYSWEEFDLGPAGAPTAPTGNAPLFRFFPPTPNPSRTFPSAVRPNGQPGALLTNVPVIGEILPSYARTMNFRLVARDNRVTGGAVDYATTTVTAVENTGPFVLTAPTAANLTWTAGIPQQVTWDVANTTAAPINAARVNVLLSTDGGRTFSIVLLAGTPNDGCEYVTVPPIYGNIPAARIKVEAAGNIFFDISDNNFAVQVSTTPTFFLSPACAPAGGLAVCPGSAVTVPMAVGQFQNFKGQVTLTATGLPAGVTATFTPSSLLAGNSTQLLLSTTAAVTPGTYPITVTGTSGSITQSKIIPLTVSVTACPLATVTPGILKGVDVYPNPSAGVFQVQINNAQRGAVQLHVTDALGRTMLSQKLTKNGAALQHTIDLSQLANGVYQLHLALPDGSTVTRLLKQ
ncbi:reprolysin-like metallopeptidase [Hymenobacter sp. GOD-10R]|uniref:reprolysin-like metallopeptidase n=1 Tax=Hymenobacter sp. GOD-10R TaxID=3093922 RepID=UPI002D76A008|nr:zinc-dependent metalloprotease family protein [Hymenobacter sp. GOD-10R]WRQ27490.1 zinc-dependent metalloprotease family protein [Hymenobacter sp. GOD-10R]